MNIAGVLRAFHRPRATRSRGQSIVEFALILPVLILLLLITLDFGRLFLSYVTLNNVTRVAANFGATSPESFTGTPSTSTYDAVVDREVAGLNCSLRPDAGGNTPPIPTYPDGTDLGAKSVATMTCDFSLLTPFITAFFGGPLPISAKAEFPIRTGAVANIGGTTTLPPPGSPQALFRFTGVTGGSIDSFGNVSGPGPITVNITNDSVNAQTFDWDWGDGSPHEYSSVPVAHTFTASHTVTLTVTNPAGPATFPRTVTVTSVPGPVIADFYGTPVGSPPQASGGGSGGLPIQGSYPLVVNFTNASTNGTAYSWDFGDGGSSTTTSPQHQYSSLGYFSVTLSVTDPPGATPITRSAYVIVGCVVPTFANTSTSDAQSSWTAAHFIGTITYQQDGAPGGSGSSKNPPATAKNIVSQTLTGGAFEAPTRQNATKPWVCDQDITLVYTP